MYKKIISIYKNLETSLKEYNNKNPWYKDFYVISISIVFLLFLSILIFHAYKSSLLFSGIPINGAFQHFNPLRRLAEGQIPGVDFLVFHGTGLTLLFYPIYALLGENLFASEFSRYFMNSLSIFGLNFIFLKVFFTNYKSRTILFISMLVTLGFQISGFFWLLAPLGPAYSSLGVRSFFPILSFIIAYIYIRKIGIKDNKSILILSFIFALCSVITLFVATEQGMATTLAFLGAIFLLPVKSLSLGKRLIMIACFIVCTYILFYTLFFVYSLGDISKPVSFVFKDVPLDQIWYFGAPPNRILTSFADLYRSVTDISVIKQIILFLTTIILSIYFLLRKKSSLTEAKIFFIFIMIIYGVISITSNIGMYSPHYFELSTRVGIFILLILFFDSIAELIKNYFGGNYWNGAKKVGMIGVMIYFATVLLGNITYINSEIEKEESMGSQKYSGSFLRGGIRDNYFGIIERNIGIPKKELSIENSFSDYIWENGIMKTSALRVPKNDVAKIRVGDTLSIGEEKFDVLGVNKETGEILIPGNMFRNILSEHIQVYPEKKKTIQVTTSPFYSTDTFPDENLRGFVNGIGRNGENSVIVLETIPDTLRFFDTGDIIEFSDGQQAEIIEINRSEIYIKGDSIELQPYIHGYPNPIKIYSGFNEAFEISIVDRTNERFTHGVSNLLGIRIENKEILSGYGIGDVLEDDNGRICNISSIDGGNLLCTPDKESNGDNFYVNSTSFEPLNSTDIWSTYSGLLEDHYGVFNPSGFDYIIHVLGQENRVKYVERFKEVKPKYVVTLRPDYTAYEKWIQNTSWNFYEEIVRSYDVVDFTGYSILWKRKTQIEPLTESLWNDAKIINNKIIIDTLKIENLDELDENEEEKEEGKEEDNSSEEKIYVVEVEYEVNNKLSSIPIFGNSPRYLLVPMYTDSPLPISLPPYENKWSFPLYMKPENNKNSITLSVNTINPIPVIQGKIIVKSARFKTISPNKKNIDGMINSKLFYLYDNK